MKKEFILPEEDMEFLEKYKCSWETVLDGRNQWLLIHDFPVCDGYNYEKVMVALKIDSGYPTSQIDMVYFNPPLKRKDGMPIGATSAQQISGMNFQRWSRHRTRLNPWRPGIDNLQSHLLLVENWLEREFKIR